MKTGSYVVLAPGETQVTTGTTAVCLGFFIKAGPAASATLDIHDGNLTTDPILLSHTVEAGKSETKWVQIRTQKVLGLRANLVGLLSIGAVYYD